MTNANGVLLNLNGNSQTVGTLSGGGPAGGNISLGAGTLTVGNSGNYGGTISDNGSGGPIMNGAGTLSLGGNNTFTGGTTVSAGTLAGSGTLSSATVSVQGGAAIDLSTLSLGNATLNLGGAATAPA